MLLTDYSASKLGPVIQRKQGTIVSDREIKESNSTERKQFTQVNYAKGKRKVLVLIFTGVQHRSPRN
ncbi:hypothetical protein EES38_21370 [Vibrio viridaestus]|uniref:Uncharacterized protein n=1 Tax=Vibrio viridaestus TaxID=2487322 RepID=A0A3N9TAY1_9VIBR|nr:hypothetical protein EES38_21370 [Vibrio viridaestus]